MSVQSFVRRHYSPDVGESPIGHAAAVLAGLTLVAIGGGLIASVVFIPVGVTLGVLGLLILGGGVFAHIQSPLKFSELMDAVVGLAGAAIALTFVIAAAAMVIGLGVAVLVSVFRWLAS
jgi:hypothetical protein